MRSWDLSYRSKVVKRTEQDVVWGGQTEIRHSPEQVFERRDGGRLAAVVLVAVDVQHPFAADRQHARQDALFEASAEHDRVIFFVHVRTG